MLSLILSLCFLLKLFLSLLHMDILNMPWVEVMGRLFHSDVENFSVASRSRISVEIQKKHRLSVTHTHTPILQLK